MSYNRTQLEKEKTELETRLGVSDVTQNNRELARIGRKLQEISRILALDERLRNLQHDLTDLEKISQGDDPELSELAKAELPQKKSEAIKIQSELEDATLPKDPQDERGCIIEIRAGAGGDEAGLFAAELYRMYVKFAESKKLSSHTISTNRTGIGGYKEVIFEITSDGAYGILKYESGVHRVQRVPETEKSGRVHTSTATVAVLPIVEEQDFKIKPEDLKIEVTTSSGHGGQSVNTTYSAIRMTHIPTGIMVSCQDERSQKQNKEKAMEIIRARVFALEQEKRMKEASETRKGQIGTGDRSEKIRTYNFPQDRLTDHRIKQNFHNLPGIMNGQLDPVFESLRLASRNQS